MKASVALGNKITLEIEERDDMETLNKAITLSHPPRQCSECGEAEDLYFVSNKDKEGNVYVNYKCGGCSAKAKLGQYKTGGWFWYGNFEKWEDKKKKNESSG